MYFFVVWAMALLGIVILLLGFDQPLILLVFSASFAAVMMFVYSILLIVLNRRSLPDALKVRSYRLGRARLVDRLLRHAHRADGDPAGAQAVRLT